MNDSRDSLQVLDGGCDPGQIGVLPFDMTKMRTPAETAALIRKSPSTLSEWRKQRIHLAYYRHGSRIFYHIDDIEKYLRGGRVEVQPITGVRVDAVSR